MKNSDWQKRGNCYAKPELVPLMYRVMRHGDVNWDGLAVCIDCPVIEECLDWAYKHNEQGIWGGFGENERARARVTSRLTGKPLSALRRSKQRVLAHLPCDDPSPPSYNLTPPSHSQSVFGSLVVHELVFGEASLESKDSQSPVQLERFAS